MIRRGLSLLAVGVVSAGMIGCNPETETSTPKVGGQPIELKKDEQGWMRLGSAVKLRNAQVRAWKYGQLFLYKLFALEDGGFYVGGIVAESSPGILSVKDVALDRPHISYNCRKDLWYYTRGKVLSERLEAFKASKKTDEVRTYIKADGKYTGVKPFAAKPWPTTGYDETKKEWLDQFTGKSEHGINQLSDKSNEIAALIASSKETIIVQGTKDDKIMYKFKFETPPNKMNKKELCDFAKDGTAIISSS